MNRSNCIVATAVALLIGSLTLSAGCARRDSASQLYKIVQYQNR